MRLSSTILTLALVLPFVSGAFPQRVEAAPQGLPNRPFDIELKQADVRNIFRLLAEVSARNVVLDPCVAGVVDIRLKNTPLPLVYDAFAMKLGLRYEENDAGDIVVRCVDEAGPPTPAANDARTRVSLAETGAPLDEVVTKLAREAKLDGVDYNATTRPPVRTTLERVRLSTALSVLGDGTGLRFDVVNRRIVVRD